MKNFIKTKWFVAGVLSLALAFALNPFFADAENIISGDSDTLIQGDFLYESEVDGLGFENLNLSFSYNAESIDGGDSFSYGWNDGIDNHELGMFDGKNETGEGAEIDETGEISVSLPVEAQISNLKIYIGASVNASDDEVVLSAIQLSGEPLPVPTISIGEITYDSLQEAIDVAEVGDEINLSEGVYEITEQVDIDKPVSIIGEGEVTIKAVNSSWSTTNGEKHSIGIYAGTSESPIIISNVTFDTSGYTYGVNTYNNAYGILEDVTILNGKGAGLTVNGSTITADNLNTSGNSWGSVNIDPGSGVLTPSVFVLNSGELSEDNQIWSDGANVTDTATVTVNASGFTQYSIFGDDTTLWRNNSLSNVVVNSKNVINTIYSSISDAVTDAEAGDTLEIASGEYELGQITIDKNISIVGEDKDTVIIKPSGDTSTSSSSDLSAWILVNAGVDFNLSGVTLDGNSPTRKIARAITSYGTGVIENNIIKNIKSSKYIGMGVTVFGDMDILNNSFENIERIGAHIRKAYIGESIGTATVSGNIFTGKGDGDWVEYGIEVGASSYALLENNTISNFKGVASSDGSESAGILITDYYGVGTEADVFGNTVTDNTYGVVVGYAEEDLTIATIEGNNFADNSNMGVSATLNASVTAEENWWGTSDSLEIAEYVSENVDFTPWCSNSLCNSTTDGNEIEVVFDEEKEEVIESSFGQLLLEIPEDITVTGPSDWDGNISNMISVSTSVLPDVSSNTNIEVITSIEVGAGDKALTFDKPVKLTFKNQAGNSVGWSRNGEFTEITTVCDDETDPTLTDGADCKIDIGGDLVVWTKHFTVFTSYILTQSSSSTSGGFVGNNNSLNNVVSTTPSIDAGEGQVLGEAVFRFTNTLRPNNELNLEVYELQKFLFSLSFDPGMFDGKFGPKTASAVKMFQTAHGLVADGIVGPITNAKLNELISGIN